MCIRDSVERLPDAATIFTAEAHAAYLALDHAETHGLVLLQACIDSYEIKQTKTPHDQ